MQNLSSWSQVKHLPLLAWCAEPSQANSSYLVNAGKTLDQKKNNIFPQKNAISNPFLCSIKAMPLIRLTSTHPTPSPGPAVSCPPLCSLQPAFLQMKKPVKGMKLGKDRFANNLSFWSLAIFDFSQRNSNQEGPLPNGLAPGQPMQGIRGICVTALHFLLL